LAGRHDAVQLDLLPLKGGTGNAKVLQPIFNVSSLKQ
jgi:hypothetical protein